MQFTRLQMGVEARVVLYAPANQHEAAGQAAAQAFAVMARLEQIMSDYRPESELMQLCARSSGVPVKVSDDLFSILQTSRRISDSSGGAFDITVGPLSHLWRDARRKQQLPSELDLEAARRVVDWRNVILNERERTVQLRVNGMALDLGGIAKGYAADRAVQALRTLGFSRCLVSLAGDIAAGDPPPSAAGWKIAIAPQDENRDEDEPFHNVLLANACISTSGDAEQFIEIAGVRHSHIIDPRTGYGVTHSISVTVIAKRGEIADGLASAVSVMGKATTELAKYFGAAIRIEPGTPGGAERIIIDPTHVMRSAH